MKILAATFVVSVGRPFRNADAMMKVMDENEADVYLFPAYCLTGASCSDLAHYKCFADETNEALDKLCEYSEKTGKCFVTAVYGYDNIIVKGGDLIQKPTVKIGGKTVMVSESGTETNADVLLLPTAMDGYPCIQNDIIEFCADAANKRHCVVAVANCGFGESSADRVYKGFTGIFNSGVIVDFKSQERPETVIACADSDKKTGLIYSRPNRGTERIPYYGKNEPSRYLNELFLLQTQALYQRIDGSGLKKAVIGVSGGLDSTLALLVAENAFRMAGLPTENIIAITMPGFGTSARTHSNADSLMKLLGCTCREISIVGPTKAMFEALGHDEANRNVVYENAQARTRADILFNVGNAEGAFVVGTGDLSEAALGWCTFGGDDLAHYNPNASVPKTLVRELVKNIAATRGGDLGKVLTDIAETPISPELVEGQETEKSVGKYELIDFIMFFFAKRRAAYSDIKNLCLAVFEELDEDEIVSTLDRFYDRFKSNRFKRAAVFEGANLLGFSLPYFPADIDYELI